MRVVFDIGHGTDTKGKGVDNFKEHDFNSAVAVEAKSLAEKHGFDILFSQKPYSPEVKLNERIQWIASEHDKKPVHCLVSFHANASYTNPDATGWGVFHWYNSTNGKKLAELWAKYAEVLPVPKWGTGIWKCEPDTWTNFDIVRRPAMPCILIEHFFFTNAAELTKCNTPEFIQLAASVTVKALCEYAGKEYQDDKNIMGESVLTEAQMSAFLRKVNPNAPKGIERIYLEEGQAEGVRGDIAFCQAIHETDYFRFTGTAKIEWHNPAGLGVTGPAGVGARFPDWRTGVRAQIQHLKAYAVKNPVFANALVDPRYDALVRAGYLGMAPKWIDLNGKWAYPGTTYGQAILALFEKIQDVEIDNEQIKELIEENERLNALLNEIQSILYRR
jgi:N-acetylmuramoyl-L-alanine amidase